MCKLFRAMIVFLCLTGIVFQAQAAKPTKARAGKAVQAAKENLVLMPLHVSEDTRDMQGQMEAAIIQGLAQKYEIFSGERVLQELKKAASKENARAKKDCDETRCLEDVAIALQTENFAMVNVSKTAGGYLLSLSIKNVMTNKAVFDNSIPCKNCDVFDVVEKLKELSGSPAPVAPVAAEVAVVGRNANDPETALWNEVKSTNLIDDYQAYLAQYPKGKYIALAHSRIGKIKEGEANEVARKEQQAWQAAEQAGSEAGYQSYLSEYPQGSNVSLATIKIRKLHAEQAARNEQELQAWQVAEQGGSEGAYQNYLNAYPQGRYADSAQSKIRKLQAAQAEAARPVKWGQLIKNGTQAQSADCVFPGSNELAPGWICDEPVEGVAVSAVGSFEKSAAGLEFMKQMAATAARVNLAMRMKVQAQNMLKQYLQPYGEGNSEALDRVRSSVAKNITNETLVGTRIYKSRQSPDGTIFVLVGLDEAAVQRIVELAVKTSMNNDRAIWQQFRAGKAQDELAAEIAKQKVP